jgi:hypothetical protein
VLVKGSKDRFLGWIGKALKQNSISVPEGNGAVSWKLPKHFLEGSISSAGDTPHVTASRGRETGLTPSR